MKSKQFPKSTKREVAPFGIAVVLIAVLAFVAFSFANTSTPETTNTVPITVLDKYNQINLDNPDIFFLQLTKNVKEGHTLFVITEGHGYSGTHYYFSEDGRALGTFSYDDMIEPNEPKPPFDLSEYQSTVILSNRM